ncbi:bifunctional non-homologous end joining protein LigD [Lacrimispora sphenoides]|jgi:bifunctional non-homologous end joining protein LigD|uniref:ATP-dependent DNA ligase n=1 Tax=Lacrimispora sphenoides TaxID=29370 RepID=UPI0008BC92B8|nr:DNA ligase [Lacrimispora sphenoides]SEU07790.1 bifunctional non-homologous end joining protein LigD [Lacrimispora sphenoides]
MDIFESRNISPMLISEMVEPFDSPNFIYEIKWDGIRTLSFLDTKTDMRNKRNKLMIPIFPELESLYRQVKTKCIIDHELLVLKNGIPDFYEVQKRALMSNSFKIKLAADKYPASVIAYDILYYKDKDITMLPLMERKKYLTDVVIENHLISVSRFIENDGIKLFELVKEKGLEGTVAKRKDSLYWQGKRTKDWVKCKIMSTDDCVICGYIPKENNMTSMVLGQYDDDVLVYKGHVTLGVSLRVLKEHKYKVIDYSPFGYVPPGNDDCVWLAPELVCIVESMPTEKEGFRQPVFKGIRDDKPAIECKV